MQWLGRVYAVSGAAVLCLCARLPGVGERRLVNNVFETNILRFHYTYAKRDTIMQPRRCRCGDPVVARLRFRFEGRWFLSNDLN
jgi:hypothetical protein